MVIQRAAPQKWSTPNRGAALVRKCRLQVEAVKLCSRRERLSQPSSLPDDKKLGGLLCMLTFSQLVRLQLHERPSVLEACVRFTVVRDVAPCCAGWSRCIAKWRFAGVGGPAAASAPSVAVSRGPAPRRIFHRGSRAGPAPRLPRSNRNEPRLATHQRKPYVDGFAGLVHPTDRHLRADASKDVDAARVNETR